MYDTRNKCKTFCIPWLPPTLPIPYICGKWKVKQCIVLSFNNKYKKLYWTFSLKTLKHQYVTTIFNFYKTSILMPLNFGWLDVVVKCFQNGDIWLEVNCIEQVHVMWYEWFVIIIWIVPRFCNSYLFLVYIVISSFIRKKINVAI